MSVYCCEKTRHVPSASLILYQASYDELGMVPVITFNCDILHWCQQSGSCGIGNIKWWQSQIALWKMSLCTSLTRNDFKQWEWKSYW